MSIQLIGLNHKTAPIEIREKISFSPESLDQALAGLTRCGGVREGLILSTCNRTEIYTAVDDPAQGLHAVRQFICDHHAVSFADIAGHIYTFRDREAVTHLFRVVSSLDSMVLGENQVLGQVKDAYARARRASALGRQLDSLFEEAIRVGKRVRTETQIGKGAVSTSTAAIELARKIFETLEGKNVLIIGAGKIGELTVKNLYARGVSTVIVANRTMVKAQELAAAFCGKAIGFDDIGECMRTSNIIISSTSAPHYVITADGLRRLMAKRNNEPLFLIDLGLPRNIEPAAHSLENVYLYNIDDLAQVCDANLAQRQREARKAEEIIAACVSTFVGRIDASHVSKVAELA